MCTITKMNLIFYLLIYEIYKTIFPGLRNMRGH
jgi:hypothetical protein